MGLDRKEYMKAYRETHKAQIKASKEAYDRLHREEKKAYEKAYRLANKESRKAYSDTIVAPYRSVIDCPEGYVVHHLNHTHSDNRRSNLLVMTRSDHNAYHQFMRYGNYEKASDIIYKYEKEVHKLWLQV